MARIELEWTRIIYIILFFVVIFLFNMFIRLYITSNVHQSSFISHHIIRRGGNFSTFEGQCSQPRT
jgi:hypothetical protein